MADRMALVRGGSRGIDRTVALALASNAWDIVINYRTDLLALEGDPGPDHGARGVWAVPQGGYRPG